LEILGLGTEIAAYSINVAFLANKFFRGEEDFFHPPRRGIYG